MKYFYRTFLKISVIFLFVFSANFSISQNVGVGTTAPTNSFHVVRAPGNPNPDPLRVENLRQSANDTAFLVIDNVVYKVERYPMSLVLK